MTRHASPPAPVLPRLALRRALRKLPRAARVVFTNGCFDLLHVGHLRVLTRAKAQGDVLVVALNTDASCRRLKGPSRPLVPLRERARMLAALRPVDYVTWFEEDTPKELIRFLRPRVLVKGADWSPRMVVGREHVGKVTRVPLVAGRSTTGIVERILKTVHTPAQSPAVHRVLDANLNRAREGLRVLEDTARFLWRRAGLARSFRMVRHQLDQLTRPHYGRFVHARDAVRDTGRLLKESTRRDAAGLVAANIRRAQEALRVLEEYGKWIWPRTTTALKALRYRLYTLEKEAVEQQRSSERTRK